VFGRLHVCFRYNVLFLSHSASGYDGRGRLLDGRGGRRRWYCEKGFVVDPGRDFLDADGGAGVAGVGGLGGDVGGDLVRKVLGVDAAGDGYGDGESAFGEVFGKRVDVVDVGGRNDSELLVTCVFGKIEVGMAEVDCWFSAS
jgi:hypothetical protein